MVLKGKRWHLSNTSVSTTAYLGGRLFPMFEKDNSRSNEGVSSGPSQAVSIDDDPVAIDTFWNPSTTNEIGILASGSRTFLVRVYEASLSHHGWAKVEHAVGGF
jgi:hypothetical protein